MHLILSLDVINFPDALIDFIVLRIEKVVII